MSAQLRCALSGQQWYETKSATDPNYDYLELYNEVIDFLTDPDFTELSKSIISSFNRYARQL